MKKTFVQLLITYFLFFAVLFSIAAGTYAHFYRLFMESVITRSADSLQDGAEKLEEIVKRFLVLGSQQRSIREFSRIAALRPPFAPRQVYWLNEALERLNQSVDDMRLWSDVVAECGIVYPNGACITLRRSFERVEDYYGTYFSLSGMDLEQWLEVLRGGEGVVFVPPQGETRAFLLERGEFSGILMTYASPDRAVGSGGTTLFLLLDAEQALAMLAPEEIFSACRVTLFSDEARIAMHDRLNAEEAYRSFTSYGMVTGLRMQLDVPQSYIWGQLHLFLRVMVISLGVFMLLSLALTFYFAYHHAQPIEKLVRCLHAGREKGGKGEGISEYAYVQQTITSMENRIERMEETLARREQALRLNAAECLMAGLKRMGPIPLENTAHLLFDPFPPTYYVCIVQAGGERMEAVVSRRRMEEAAERIAEKVPCSTKSYRVQGNKLLFLIRAEAEEAAQVRALLESALRSSQGETDLTAAISDCCAGRTALPRAVEQARQLLRFAAAQTEDAVQTPRNVLEHAALPRDVESGMAHLLDAMRRGDAAFCEQTAQRAFRAIYHSAHSCKWSIEQLFFAFVRIFDQAQDELADAGIEVKLDFYYEAGEHASSLEARVKSALRTLCLAFGQIQKNAQRRLSQGVLRYIDTHLSDAQLNARQAADHFGIPAHVLQGVLRQETGQSFFEYVDDRRMELAARLLDTTALSVTDIAQLCGFALVNSFYKAFKRRFGVSPSIFREEKGEASGDGTMRHGW